MGSPSPETTPPVTPPPDPAGAATPRRTFFSLLAVLIGGLVGLIPAASGVFFFLDPVLRKSRGAGGGLLRGPNAAELPSDGTPVRITLRSDIVDAWNVYRDRVIGSVYLRMMPNGQILAFNDTCTHLGCKVDYQSAEKRFFCPCHQSAFGLDGVPENKTPPRPLDELDTEIKDGVVWIRYKNFRTATPEKVEI